MEDRNGQANGHRQPPAKLEDVARDEAELVAAMEHSHTFPGFYPVVVIGQHGPDFLGQLTAAILLAQGSEPYTIRERNSAGGRYVAYHVALYVDTARTALHRKQRLAEVPGVLWLL